MSHIKVEWWIEAHNQFANLYLNLNGICENENDDRNKNDENKIFFIACGHTTANKQKLKT